MILYSVCLEINNYLNCCCSVTQSCPILCNSMDCSTPGFPVPHHLPKFTQDYVHCIGDTIQPFLLLMTTSPSALNLSQNQDFSNESTVHIKWTNTEASASVLSRNIQAWFPLRLTGLISSQSNRLKCLLQDHSLKASILWWCAFFMSRSHNPMWPVRRQ